MPDRISANVIADIEQVDRLIDANMAALFMRLRCVPPDCRGFETAWRRCPDLRIASDVLMRRRGQLQLERDRLLNIEHAREQRREAAKRRRAAKAEAATPPVWRSVVTIGELEGLAGIDDRAAFWLPFAKHADGFDRGVASLRAMAEQRAAS